MGKSSWLERSAFDLLSKRKNFPFHYWASYYRAWSVLFNTTQTRIWHLLFALFTTLFLFPLLHPSSSQVGIHHHVGGRLTSDSVVNVNYCSLSEPRESGTCRAVRRCLRRTQNNQPVFVIPSLLLFLGRPFHSPKHAHLTLCLSHLHSDQNYFVTLMLLIAFFNFPDNRPSLKMSHWFPAYLPVCLKIHKLLGLSKQDCEVLWFPPLRDWFGYIPPMEPCSHGDFCT